MIHLFRSLLHKLWPAGKNPPDIRPAPSVMEDTPAESTRLLNIWAITRDRFGVRQQALCTEVEVTDSQMITLCEGVRGYTLRTPNGETAIIEGHSGGLIGHSLDMVQEAIRDTPCEELVRQIDSNRREFERMKACMLAPVDFWAALYGADSTHEDYSQAPE